MAHILISRRQDDLQGCRCPRQSGGDRSMSTFPTRHGKNTNGTIFIENATVLAFVFIASWTSSESSNKVHWLLLLPARVRLDLYDVYRIGCDTRSSTVNQLLVPRHVALLRFAASMMAAAVMRTGHQGMKRERTGWGFREDGSVSSCRS